MHHKDGSCKYSAVMGQNIDRRPVGPGSVAGLHGAVVDLHARVNWNSVEQEHLLASHP